jgi:hypothetical protein
MTEVIFSLVVYTFDDDDVKGRRPLLARKFKCHHYKVHFWLAHCHAATFGLFMLFWKNDLACCCYNQIKKILFATFKNQVQKLSEQVFSFLFGPSYGVTLTIYVCR